MRADHQLLVVAAAAVLALTVFAMAELWWRAWL